MQTKLTLRLEEELIKRAKSYARGRGKSVSQIVADYFLVLGSDEKLTDEKAAPTTRSLRGILRGTRVDESDYRKHLEERFL